MRYFLLFLALFLQLNASGYTDDNPQKNCTQKTLTAESSENNERSFVLFRDTGRLNNNELKKHQSDLRDKINDAKKSGDTLNDYFKNKVKCP
jgi:hypothetical protein